MAAYSFKWDFVPSRQTHSGDNPASIRDVRVGVIRDRAEPAAGPAMSAMPPKAEASLAAPRRAIAG